MTNTFIDDLEEIVDATAIWASEQIDMVVEVLAPDGRPFGTQPLTNDAKILQYMQLRNNPTAWKSWIGDRALTIVQELSEAGVKPEDIEAIAPLDIAVAFATDYSVSMEKLIEDKVDG